MAADRAWSCAASRPLRGRGRRCVVRDILTRGQAHGSSRHDLGASLPKLLRHRSDELVPARWNVATAWASKVAATSAMSMPSHLSSSMWPAPRGRRVDRVRPYPAMVRNCAEGSLRHGVDRVRTDELDHVAGIIQCLVLDPGGRPKEALRLGSFQGLPACGRQAGFPHPVGEASVGDGRLAADTVELVRLLSPSASRRSTSMSTRLRKNEATLSTRQGFRQRPRGAPDQ